ncbi:membrane-associated protease RseP (regulator of RpoE activity) [Clavibacter michiganensis]|uniref:M50 family metallopeptidase n=1 Tax=Clavibacter michiganensis TaxID=28447 RepID=UPI001AE5DF87|nr:site-2 protease family protein [Clavibacter michiganensis]MBP2458864.1 membrane-associated protease RseP (regulator of RpoE activity) [Clavibacter michiganensis]MDQ0411436.1 membrane-associated protease RseP (regulator of RpoE activity) [Clavibacter michiganensis]
MDGVFLYILGVLIIVVGVAVSIGLHEVGHLVPAKLFGVRVTQYMIGFGPTIFSRRRGETEYGVKAIPLGGYISMIGMFPPQSSRAGTSSTGIAQLVGPDSRRGADAASPAAPDADDRAGRGFFDLLVQDARQASAESVGDEEDRAFYKLPVLKRMVIMLGGPAMNFLLAIVLFAIVLCGFGVTTPTTTVGQVNACIVPAGSTASADAATCPAGAPEAPGAAAGLQPGDTIVSIDGEPITAWDQVTGRVQVSAGTELDVVVERDGARQTLAITPVLTQQAVIGQRGAPEVDEQGNPVTREVGLIGFSPTQAVQQQPLSAAFTTTGENMAAVGNLILNLPQRLVDVGRAAFGGGERDPNGPMSVVGVGRVAGEIASLDETPVASRASAMIGLVASLNVALGMINLLPLLPLDGGHVLGAIVEGVRRFLAKAFGRRDPGPVDVAKLMPLTFVVVILFGAMSALLIFADLVNPVRLT